MGLKTVGTHRKSDTGNLSVKVMLARRPGRQARVSEGLGEWKIASWMKIEAIPRV